MIVKTDFNRGGAGNLVKYIQRDRDQDRQRTVPLRNQAGRELTQEEIQQFVEQSRDFGFERHLIVAPNPDAGYTPAEVGANTRQLAQQQFGQEPQTRYLYGVHTDSCYTHAHVAATGREAELRMDRQEIQRLRDRARTQFRERERLSEREQARERVERADRREQAHERELDPAAREQGQPDREVTPEPQPDADAHAEPEQRAEPEQDYSWGGGQ